jgi:hypothetical protein
LRTMMMMMMMMMMVSKSCHIVSNDWMVANNELKRIWKETIVF